MRLPQVNRRSTIEHHAGTSDEKMIQDIYIDTDQSLLESVGFMSNFTRQTYMFKSLVSSRLGWVLLLASCSCLSGGVPGLTRNFTGMTLSATAVAQEQADFEKKLGKYAEAILQMEPLRLQSYQQVQQIMGASLPKDVCKQSDLLAPVDNICDRFFNESAEIIRGNGLSLTDFNAITEEVRRNKTLKDQLNEELLRRKRN